jgi:hypothetical protein
MSIAKLLEQILIIEMKCQIVESRGSGFRNNMLLLTAGPPALSCPDTCQKSKHNVTDDRSLINILQG